MSKASSASPAPVNTAQLILRASVGYSLFILMIAIILFGVSGRTDWIMAWALVAIYAAATVVAAVGMFAANRELFWERMRPNQAGAKGWDKILSRLMSVIGPIAIWAVAALDAREGWTWPLPLPISAAAAAIGSAAYALTLWALFANPFFSAVVRIQTDRGHAVVSGGPYRWLRHPGYAGSIVFTALTPIMLGSLWGLVPAAAVVAVSILRTTLEDRTLQAELPGYAEYARKVRHRLLPGVW